MNSSNSFNICPRCGNSNSLNAKYCSRCGAQLKVPTEAVVCHKCHTRNYSLANFCRNCGATLKVGAQTKICPRCGREIGSKLSLAKWTSLLQTRIKSAIKNVIKTVKRIIIRNNPMLSKVKPSSNPQTAVKNPKRADADLHCLHFCFWRCLCML